MILKHYIKNNKKKCLNLFTLTTCVKKCSTYKRDWIGSEMKVMTHTLIAKSLLPFQEKLDYFCFIIFLFFCAGTALYVWFNVPETKNRTALEIAAEFQKLHCTSKREKSTDQKLNLTKIFETKL